MLGEEHLVQLNLSLLLSVSKERTDVLITTMAKHYIHGHLSNTTFQVVSSTPKKAGREGKTPSKELQHINKCLEGF